MAVISVKNLKISFNTPAGKVQAVRGISFDLKRGETLAIVGESGSGKSVTARSLLGILAPNAVIESGEIVFDGKNILDLNEEEFCKLRGEKISMIFQDPLSSLNPIVKIGKQLTEAMIIKNGQRRKKARKSFNTRLKNIEEALNGRAKEDGAFDNKTGGKNSKLCSRFNAFEENHVKLEEEYSAAQQNAESALIKLNDLILRVEKKQDEAYLRLMSNIAKLIKSAYNDYVISEAERAETERLSDILKTEKNIDAMRKLSLILDEAVKRTPPDFFYLGYYVLCGKAIPKGSISEINKTMRAFLIEDFMAEFQRNLRGAAEFSYKKTLAAVKKFTEKIDENSEFYKTLYREPLDLKIIKIKLSELKKEIAETVDPLAVENTQCIKSFCSNMTALIKAYEKTVKFNVREQKRFRKQMAVYKKRESAGKPDYEVAPLSVVDLSATVISIQDKLNDLIKAYGKFISEYERAEDKELFFAERAVQNIDKLKEDAGAYGHVITRKSAKNRAIRLMEEVGIAEPQKRYNQYPFEFSGGMRQRIVIAIALASNPDILICDEPTTALDVTIQAQILELIAKLKEKRKMSVIFITHDLGVVANVADRIAVMYAGKIVEEGTVKEVFYDPRHPYTWALLSSMPDLDTKEELEAIPGTPPNMIYPPKGDAFAERNKYALEIDFVKEPPLIEVTPTHYAATWLLHPDSPKISPPAIVSERIRRMRKLNENSNIGNK